MPLPSVFQGVRDCRLPGLKPPKPFQRSRRPPRQQLLQLQLHAPAICFSGGSRLPFARPETPQTLPTLPQASKATTLTATCPCHLFFRGFETAVCPASNPPNPSNASAGLQGNNSYSYMPLPSLFQGVQDCRLPGLKPPKLFQRSRRPPRQQLLQLYTCPCHLFFRGFETAVCPASNPPNPSNASAGLQGNNSYSYMPLPSLFQGVQDCRLPGLKPPNSSNAPAGLQGNNSYSYMPLPSVFQGVQDCRLPGLKPPKPFQRSRRPPRQQLLQLHAPAICFSGGSRLPFARPQTPQTLPTLPQASKATTLTATTCPCHLFFRGFETAVCPASNPPNSSNAPAGVQGNNSYSYMPLPSVFQGVRDCRLPGLKPPKPFQRFRRPPRQQLLQLHAPAISFSGGSRLPLARPQTPQTLPTLPQASKATTLTAIHAPAICFSGGSRLPFARPQTPQTLPTLPQASKATTLTATTCPCHLFFRGFKTAVCPASNPPNSSNAPAGLQGNNSYSYMPLPSVFQGVRDCRLPGLKPPKPFQRFRRPPRQQLLQLHAPAISFSGGSRLPFARPQTPQTLPTLPQASKATTLTAIHAPAICFSGGSRLPFARPQTPQTLPTLPQASKATTLTATCPCHLFFRGFKTAVCPASNPPNSSNAPAGLQGNNSYSYMPLPSVFQGVQDCRLPGLKPPKPFQRSRRPPRQQLLQLHAPAICFSVGSRLPFSFKTAVCPASNPPNSSNAPAGLQGNNSYSYMPLPTVFQGVQDCRLPGLKPPKPFQRSRRPPRQQLLQLHAPAICFSGGSRLPFARPQTPQTLPTLPQASKATTLTAIHAPAICFSGGSRLPFARPQTPQTLPTLPQASKATTLTATCPCHLFFRGFKTAVCPASNPPNPSNAPAGLQGNNSYSYMPLPSVFQGVRDCRLPGLKPPKPFQRTAGLQGNNSYSYMPLPSVFQWVQDCRLPGLKPPKPFQRFRRPPRQQLLQLHAPAISFSGGSRLPFARPQTPQTLPTLPQASKATTLTATCPCHLFFRGFKTAVCPASNPPNPSNASAGLQGNNSYSYMPLPSVFQEVQDCRLPAFKPPKPFQRSRRPPRQQLLQLHAPAICFSGGSRLPFSVGSRLPFARPQTPQTLPTLPQASKATTLTATCPCHLFFKGFKTAVCPASNPPNPSNAPASLQGNNSYSYMPLPSVFQGVQDCRLPGLKPPKPFQRFRRPPRQQLLQLHAPAICLSGVQDCRLPALKPPKPFQRSRRPPRQQLLQLHAPAICFSGGSRLPFSVGSRLPFARPQTPQTLPTLPQASKATTLTATCPCHLFFRGFKTAVCPASNPPGLPTLPQASKATTLTATCPCHLFFRGFKTAVCPASNPPNPSNASAGLQGNNSYSYMPLPSVFQAFKTAVCPPSNPPNPSNAPAGLQGNNSYSYMPLPSVFQEVQDCRLPGLKPPKPFQRSRRPPRQQLLQLHAPAICFSGGSRLPFSVGSRLPFARPQTPQTLPTLPQASKATTLTATCPCHLFFRGFKTAVCPASNPPNPPNAPASLQGNNSYSYMPLPSVFQGVQDCRLPGLKPPKPFQRFRRPPRQQLLQLHAPAICLSGVQDCRLPALKPPKPFQCSRRPPRQQLLQLQGNNSYSYAPAICFSGGSRLPFARPQTPQTLPTLPQASKATTLTATCPCHLSFRRFKTAVCPPSNPPNPSNAPAGLQGNNSYSYMPLPSLFQGVQDCRLPGLKPPKPFQRSRRPPRQQLLQLHAPATCRSRTIDF